MSKLHLGFCEPATPIMEGIIDLHNNIFIYLIFISAIVFWITVVLWAQYICVLKDPITVLVKQHRGDFFQFRSFTHHSILEIIWTTIPSLILINIVVPSFEMLYAMDSSLSGAMTVKVIGHQWYWSYEFFGIDGQVTFDSNLVFDADLEYGHTRLLETDLPLVLPVDMPIRFIITSTDVLHSWSVPSFGIKCDAVPGRLNQVFALVKREGVFYGQCSELCGPSHGFMPIKVVIKTL